MIIPLPPDCSKRLFEAAPHLRERAWTSTHSNVIVVESPQMQQVISTARQLANTDATALIQGESGTGKEILAKAIHAWSHRAGQPFITIDCTTLPESLIESELFGHERGAFTGALTTKKGLFEEANRGTIFLDEVGELALSAQVKLLRVLQEQTFRRVGGTTPIHIDVRILAATNKDLQRLVRKGIFREDLYYRLDGIVLTIPPLRQRREDIPALAHHFCTLYSHRFGRDVVGISTAAMEMLLWYSWPGNVRELEKAIERAIALGRSGCIAPEDLPPSLWGREDSDSPPPPRRHTLEEIEKTHIRAALLEHGGNQTKAAEALGISRTTLWRKMKKYAMEWPV